MVKRVKLFIMSCLLAIMQILPLFQPAVVYAASGGTATLKTGQEINEVIRQLLESDTTLADEPDITIGTSYLTLEDIGGTDNLSEDMVEVQSSGDKVYLWYSDYEIMLVTDAAKVKLNEDSSYMFSGLDRLGYEGLLGSDIIDATGCKNLDHMFDGDNNLQRVKMENLTVASGATADEMLTGCDALKIISLPKTAGSSDIDVALPMEMHEDTDDEKFDGRTENAETVTTGKIGHDESHSYMTGHKVTFNANGNTTAFKPQYVAEGYGSVSLNATVSNNDTVSPNEAGTAPEKDGYTFTGDWYTSENFEEKFSEHMRVDKDITLYGKYAVTEYWFNYFGNAADAEGSMVSSNHIYGKPESLLKNGYSRNGYTFNAWNTEADGSGKTYTDKETVDLEIDDIADSKINLYAQWQANSYTILFDGNGATTTADSATPSRPMIYDREDNLSRNTFDRIGYTFMGWSDTKNGAVKYADEESVKNLSGSANGTVTLYAVWQPKAYKIVFNGSDPDSGSMAEMDMLYGEQKTLTSNGFTKAGYDFRGWAEKEGSTAVKYYNNAKVSNLTSVNGGTICLYAVWTPRNDIKYTVKHYYMDAAGGYPSAPNKTVEGHGTTNTTVKAALNYNSDQYEKPAEQTVKILPDGSAAVAYYYPRKKYTLTVKKGDYTQEVIGGGTYYWGERVTINATPNASPNPVITYVFKNWQGYQYSRTKEYTFTMPAYNTEMVANCTEKDLYKYNTKTTTNGQVINGVTFKKFTSYASGEGSAADTENTNTNTDIIETKRKQGQNITQFPDVQKEGYQSTGWYTAPTGGTRVDKTTTMPDTATSYYAQWKPNTYTIKFRNGSKESYAKGGFPAQINNVQYDSQSDINIAGCDAKAWRGSITFDTCGGTFSGGEDGKRTTYSTTLKWTTGYNGSNWGDSSQKNNSLKYNNGGMSYGNNADGHDTIKKYAGGTINGTVTNLIQGYEYQRNNGATMYLYAQYSGVEDTTAPASDKISRSHYNFLGWYTAANGGSKKADGGGTLTNQNGYLTYYAHWDPWDATIYYDGNSGYPTNASTSVGGSVGNQTITYDEENQVKDNGFSRTGYIFTGWNTKADGSGTSVTPGQKLYNKFWSSPNLLTTDLATMTLYAQWKPIKYYVQFNSNGGSGYMGNQTFTFDQAANLNGCSFSRGTGWTFINWTTGPSGGTGYSDGQNVNNLTSVDGAEFPLYAQWQYHAPMKELKVQLYDINNNELTHGYPQTSAEGQSTHGDIHHWLTQESSTGQKWKLRVNNRDYAHDRILKATIRDTDNHDHEIKITCDHKSYTKKGHITRIDCYTEGTVDW